MAGARGAFFILAGVDSQYDLALLEFLRESRRDNAENYCSLLVARIRSWRGSTLALAAAGILSRTFRHLCGTGRCGAIQIRTRSVRRFETISTMGVDGMNAELNSVWKISDSARSTYTEDGAVVLDIEKGQCYGLNIVAAKIWSSLESNESGIVLQDLVNALQSTFNVPHKELEADIAEHLGKLEKMGLVHRSTFRQAHASS